MLIRMRKLACRPAQKLMTKPARTERVAAKREAKAEVAARIETAIERELLSRLQVGGRVCVRVRVCGGGTFMCWRVKAGIVPRDRHRAGELLSRLQVGWRGAWVCAALTGDVNIIPSSSEQLPSSSLHFLQSGTYGDIYNFPTAQFAAALDREVRVAKGGRGGRGKGGGVLFFLRFARWLGWEDEEGGRPPSEEALSRCSLSLRPLPIPTEEAVSRCSLSLGGWEEEGGALGLSLSLIPTPPHTPPPPLLPPNARPTP